MMGVCVRQDGILSPDSFPRYHLNFALPSLLSLPTKKKKKVAERKEATVGAEPAEQEFVPVSPRLSFDIF